MLSLDEYLDIKEENEELKRKLVKALRLKSKYKRLYEKLKPPRKSKRLEKTQKALDMIAEREAGAQMTLRYISEQTGVNYNTLTTLAWQYRQAIKSSTKSPIT